MNGTGNIPAVITKRTCRGRRRDRASSVSTKDKKSNVLVETQLAVSQGRRFKGETEQALSLRKTRKGMFL